MKKNLKLIEYSVLITLTFFAPQKLLGMVNPDRVDHRAVSKIVREHLADNPGILDSSKGKDIVVFLGNTGAGKSTLINYLSGKQLEVNDSLGIQLTNPNDPSAMRIGLGATSETSLPKFIEVVGALLFYDLPGLQDTKGTAQNLANAAFIKYIIENANSVKLVFVVGIEEIIAVKGLSFKNLLRQVKQLIPDKHIEDFSSLIITKSYLPKAALPNFIKSKIEDPANPNPDLSVLDSWIKNSKIDQMAIPMTGTIDHQDAVSILNLISSMKSDRIENVNIGMIYDTSQQLKIKGIYDVEIGDIIAKLIAETFQAQNLSSLNKEKLENMRSYFKTEFAQAVSLALEQSSLIELLRPISADVYLISWDEQNQKLNYQVSSIAAQIDGAIAVKEKQDEERRRLQAEAELRQAQERARLDQERVYRAEQESNASRAREAQRLEQTRKTEEAKRAARPREAERSAREVLSSRKGVARLPGRLYAGPNEGYRKWISLRNMIPQDDNARARDHDWWSSEHIHSWVKDGTNCYGDPDGTDADAVMLGYACSTCPRLGFVYTKNYDY